MGIVKCHYCENLGVALRLDNGMWVIVCKGCGEETGQYPLKSGAWKEWRGWGNRKKALAAAKPEPRPTPGRVDVLPEVIKDLQARDKVGTVKYGTTLQSHNGRNCLMDAYQEALDLAMYLKQKLIEEGYHV